MADPTVPTRTQHNLNGIELAIYEWPGADPPVLFAHATGFHARCWDQVIARLPGRHCYAVDLRGHGRSAKPGPPYRWRDIGADVAGLGRVLGLHGALGVGHSMGGHAVALAASLEPGLFAGLILLDPVILPRAWYAGATPGEHFAARRRNHWHSHAEMYERFRDRPPFSRWDPAVLHDYCAYGLLPNPGHHDYILACPPALEAELYRAATDANIYPELEALDIPVRVIRAGRPASELSDMEGSPTAPDLATCLRHGEDIVLPDHSHFIPMEDPALVARSILSFAC